MRFDTSFMERSPSLFVLTLKKKQKKIKQLTILLFNQALSRLGNLNMSFQLFFVCIFVLL